MMRTMLGIWLLAAFVGFVHSLAPGHWLPVVLLTKSRKWNFRQAVTGAFFAASGHIIVSIGAGVVALTVGAQFLSDDEHLIEKYSGLGLLVFGLLFAAFAYFRHFRCRGHTHHGPENTGQKTAYAFLFTIGLSPCVAVLPVFVAASPAGIWSVLMAMALFAAGVVAALVSATLLVNLGLVKLDHPVLEHYGDVITGLGVALIGLFLFLSNSR